MSSKWLGAGSAAIDHTDVDLMLTELYITFQARVELKVFYRGEHVEVIAVASKVNQEPEADTIRQAFRRIHQMNKKPLENLIYECLWDVYMQFDSIDHQLGLLPKDASHEYNMFPFRRKRNNQTSK
jgi:hypothetical protein